MKTVWILTAEWQNEYSHNLCFVFDKRPSYADFLKTWNKATFDLPKLPESNRGFDDKRNFGFGMMLTAELWVSLAEHDLIETE